MAKAEFIRARVDENLKANTEILFSRLGLTMTEAITLFLTQCEMQQGLPFAVKIPNAATEAAMRECEEMLASGSYTTYNSAREMHDAILAEGDTDV